MPTNIHRNLSNDQRARLEQITHDEFAIKMRELQNKKNEDYRKWVDAEIKKMETSELAKKYIKLRKELDSIIDKIANKGFTVDNVEGKARCTLRESSGYGINNRKFPNHPQVEEMKKRARIDNDAFTRAKNEVLSVIWSMEQPFTACVNLIKNKVNSIK